MEKTHFMESVFPAYIYLFKVNNRNTRKMSEMWNVIDIALVFLFFTLKMLYTFSSVFIVDFEQLNISWVIAISSSKTKTLPYFQKN